MGVVYEAADLKSGRRVALKLLASTVAEEMPDIVARFQREVQAASAIDCDNIVRVYDAGSDESGAPYMAMELVKGKDWHQWARFLQIMSPEVVVRLAGQTCHGLSRAHAAGVIHRDIKPGNIFLAEGPGPGEYTAKILDFGIAKLKMDQVQGDPGLTKTGNMLGSPHYMSPEQAQGLKTIDARTDVWSLGVVMYKALTGRTPFADLDSMGQVIIAIFSMPIPPVQDLAPWVTPELAAIVHRALQKKPGDRFASADEMGEALRALTSDGSFRVTAAMLEPLSEQARGVVAPRLGGATSAEIGLVSTIPEELPSKTSEVTLGVTTHGDVTLTSLQKKQSRTSVLIGVVGGAVVASVAGVGWLQLSKGKDADVRPAATVVQPAASGPAAPPSASSSSAPPPASAAPSAASAPAGKGVVGKGKAGGAATPATKTKSDTPTPPTTKAGVDREFN